MNLVVNSALTNIAPKRWIAAFCLWLCVLLAVFYSSLQTVTNVWLSSNTFNHCFFVLPGALYFLWKERGQIFSRQPSYSLIGFLLVLGALLLYALGKAALIDLFEHVALFALIPFSFLMVLGFKVTRTVIFPLAFIFFSVPIGEELVPLFQSITADMSIFFLKLLSVPVYRDGLYISVPNGQFVVAEACSGVRFFVACVVLGAAYAYLNFIALWRSLLFLLLAILLPIVANGLRAFGTIYIGHISNMEHAVGTDHLVYGWFFFAFIIVVLFTIGHFFSDGHHAWRDQIEQIHPGWESHWCLKTLLVAALPIITALLLGLLSAHHSENTFDPAKLHKYQISSGQANDLSWVPRYSHADLYRVWGIGTRYGRQAHVFQAIYQHNQADKELINSLHRLYDPDLWSLKRAEKTHINGAINARILHLVSSGGQHRLMVYWYYVPDFYSVNPLWVKFYQAWNTLTIQPSGGLINAISMEFSGDVGMAKATLLDVVNENLSSLRVD